MYLNAIDIEKNVRQAIPQVWLKTLIKYFFARSEEQRKGFGASSSSPLTAKMAGSRFAVGVKRLHRANGLDPCGSAGATLGTDNSSLWTNASLADCCTVASLTPNGRSTAVCLCTAHAAQRSISRLGYLQDYV